MNSCCENAVLKHVILNVHCLVSWPKKMARRGLLKDALQSAEKFFGPLFFPIETSCDGTLGLYGL